MKKNTHLKTVSKTVLAFVGGNPLTVSPLDRIRNHPVFKGGNIPFTPQDTTAGSETELQVAVEGQRNDVDLPITIEESNYLANIVRRAAAGDAPRKRVVELRRFLDDTSRNVWENSWVRFPASALNTFARKILDKDMLADKKDPEAGPRSDLHKLRFFHDGEEYIRVPVSYLLKLSLADVLGSDNIHPLVFETGIQLLDHFLNDNTSPETHSFHVVSGGAGRGPGKALARETAKRFLLTQLLVMYANEKYGLKKSGQRAMAYFSPHPPVRQRKLNDCISDSYYRELFMSPCLSGWDKGEAKQEYMGLCHEVLSRSQLNCVAKLRDAGIITSNLVVLPNTSNISLANNGAHVSLGSLTLNRLRDDRSSGFGATEEKYAGDLAIKIVEHFLPLFVNTYSAAPYRLGFSDFHPERVLGYLPHELDYTHLRMLWRRWKGKAAIRFAGSPVTPFGPPWIDKVLSNFFGLKGDYIPDFRLIDYLVSLLSTEKSAALNGVLGNHDALKKDLADLGVFDTRMSVYLPYKLREYDRMGFSGFEGRYYSLFPSLSNDMAQAVDLQNLITALAFKYILGGRLTHRHIPDSPFLESERRQIFFGAAIAIPTFFVHQNTDNLFLASIVEKTKRVRNSSRYPGYARVHTSEYCKALIETIRQDGGDLIELFGMEETLANLERRLEAPEEHGAAGQLKRGILNHIGARNPLKVDADEFNGGAESYYRNSLRLNHLSEAFDVLEEDVASIISLASQHQRSIGRLLYGLAPTGNVAGDIDNLRKEVLNENASAEELLRLIFTMVLTIRADKANAAPTQYRYEETGS